MTMRHFGVYLMVFGFALTVQSQTVVRVVDADQQRPLPAAHITYSSFGAENAQTVLTDANGNAEIPKEFTERNPCFAAKVSYIGFKSAYDTLRAGEQHTFLLEFQDQSLNEVVITAQYAPNNPDKAVHKIRIIDQEKIERMAAVNLEDVLTNEMNIRISQDAILGSSISMQGISGQNVKIMIDGMPVIGRQDGNIDLNQINLNDIERIEIIEGPLSVNFGTDALAGTINLITKKKSREKTDIQLSSYNESIGRYNLSGSVAKQFGKLRVALSGGRNFFNGWDSGDRIEPNNEQLIADFTRVKSWNPKEQYFGRVQLSLNLKKTNLHYRSELFTETITNRGMPRAPYFEQAFDDYYRTDRMDHSLSASGALSKSISFNAVAAYNAFLCTKNTYLTDLTTLDQRLSVSPGDQDTSAFSALMSRASLIFAQDSSKLQWEVGYDINHEMASGRRIENGEQSISDVALFTTAEYTFLKNFTVRPGLRWAYNTNYNAPLTPSINLRYAFGKWIARGSYARGFRAPGLKEMYFNFVDVNHNLVGNESLEAEYSNNFTASLKRKYLIRQTIIQWEAAGFYNDIQNLITLGITDQETQSYSYINVGQSQTGGMNASGSLLLKHLKFNLGFAYIGLKNQLANELGKNNFVYYPEVTSSAVYDFHKLGVTASLFFKHQGRLPRVAVNENGELYTSYIDAYNTVDFNLSRTFYEKRIQASGGVKNLLDVQQVDAGGGSTGAHSTGAPTVPIGMGRLYFLKLDVRWKK